MRLQLAADPIAMFIGYFIVAAEPAVHVLNRQVEEITAGSISRQRHERGTRWAWRCRWAGHDPGADGYLHHVVPDAPAMP